MNLPTYSVPLGSVPTSFVNLRTPLDAASVADACRSAALAFARDAPDWRRSDLLRWLRNAYLPLTRHTTMDRAETADFTALASASEASVRAILSAAHSEARSRLERLRDRRYAEGLGLTMFSFGFIARFEDSSGAVGCIPTSRPRRLVDRVSSLVAADLLARPVDYPTIAGAETSSRHRAAVGAYLLEVA